MWHRGVVFGSALVALVSMVGCDRGNAAPRPSGTSDPVGKLASNAGSPAVAVVDTAGNALIKRTVLEVTEDVNRLSAASAAEQKQRLGAHISAVNGMLSRFEDKVRAMHVTMDPDWVAVIDSVKNDVARMPDMPTGQLHDFLPEHNRRVMRIVACVDMTRL
jgi:hypothetical protein